MFVVTFAKVASAFSFLGNLQAKFATCSPYINYDSDRKSELGSETAGDITLIGKEQLIVLVSGPSREYCPSPFPCSWNGCEMDSILTTCADISLFEIKLKGLFPLFGVCSRWKSGGTVCPSRLYQWWETL